MELSTLKNVSVSALILFFIGCEDTRFEEGTPVDDSYGTVYVSVESVPSIELNDYSWQTLKTLYGDLASDDANIMNVRIEWESDMFWLIYDTTGYFKADCRGCSAGTWYGTDGTIEPMSYDYHTMAPVTNFISITDENGSFGNVIAPVRAMRGDAMWLWWTVANVYADSMLIVLE
jgi:hypothetical protein